jgi:hypothetical protein
MAVRVIQARPFVLAVSTIAALLIPACGGLWGIESLTVADGGSDGQSEADASDCPSPLIFCDDFDHGQQPGWTVYANGGSIEIEEADAGGIQAHSPPNLLHAHAAPMTYAFWSRGLHPAVSAIYVRIYAYFVGPIDGDLENLYADPGGDPTVDGGFEYDLDAPGQQLSVQVNMATSFASTVSLPTNRWVCLEVKVVAASPSLVTLWIDGNEASPQWNTSLAGTGDARQCQFDAYDLGLDGTGSGTVDAYYDDLEIGPGFIPCSP